MTNQSINDQSVKKYDIKERALEFAVAVAKFVQQLPKNLISLEYGKQLISASSSVGANLEEADGTLSKKDFINKMGISRREARESRYWLLLIDRGLSLSLPLREESQRLASEAKEITLILSSIIYKTQNQ